MYINYLNFSLILLCTILIIIELMKGKKLNWIIFLLFLWILYQLLINFLYSHINFSSFDFWRLNVMIIMGFIFILICYIIKDYRFEIIFLNFMVLLGSLIIVSCDHLIVIFLGLELQTFSLFILIAKNKESMKGSEASLKYFILGALSSGLFLLGTSFIFTTSISLNIKEIFIYSSFDIYSIKIAFILILLSLFFKLALFPLHFWVADIYEGSSWEVISILAIIPKISIICLLLQFSGFYSFYIISAILSIIIGTIGALNQTKLKRLLAYSGISHLGFIILGVGLMNKQGCESSFVYLIIYIITLLSVFFIINLTNFGKDYYIIELGGINTVNKLLSISWLILFLSIAGIPPLSGFISKWFIITTMLNYEFLVCSLIMILFSAIAAGYYLRIIKISYFQSKSNYFIWNDVLIIKNDILFLRSLYLGMSIYFIIFIIININPILIAFYYNFNYLF